MAGYAFREFRITRAYIDAMIEPGQKLLVGIFPGAGKSDLIEDRIGCSLEYDDAESMLVKYRRPEVGSDLIQDILWAGTVQG